MRAPPPRRRRQCRPAHLWRLLLRLVFYSQQRIEVSHCLLDVWLGRGSAGRGYNLLVGLLAAAVTEAIGR